MVRFYGAGSKVFSKKEIITKITEIIHALEGQEKAEQPSHVTYQSRQALLRLLGMCDKEDTNIQTLNLMMFFILSILAEKGLLKYSVLEENKRFWTYNPALRDCMKALIPIILLTKTTPVRSLIKSFYEPQSSDHPFTQNVFFRVTFSFSIYFLNALALLFAAVFALYFSGMLLQRFVAKTTNLWDAPLPYKLNHDEKIEQLDAVGIESLEFWEENFADLFDQHAFDFSEKSDFLKNIDVDIARLLWEYSEDGQFRQHLIFLIFELKCNEFPDFTDKNETLFRPLQTAAGNLGFKVALKQRRLKIKPLAQTFDSLNKEELFDLFDRFDRVCKLSEDYRVESLRQASDKKSALEQKQRKIAELESQKTDPKRLEEEAKRKQEEETKRKQQEEIKRKHKEDIERLEQKEVERRQKNKRQKEMRRQLKTRQLKDPTRKHKPAEFSGASTKKASLRI